jgi:hypothetical protein
MFSGLALPGTEIVALIEKAAVVWAPLRERKKVMKAFVLQVCVSKLGLARGVVATWIGALA